MHLLQSGVNLSYTRYPYAHKIQTSEISARADSKQKREALEADYVNVILNSGNEGLWEKNSKLSQ
jgi:hypothetical protein